MSKYYEKLDRQELMKMLNAALGRKLLNSSLQVLCDDIIALHQPVKVSETSGQYYQVKDCTVLPEKEGSYNRLNKGGYPIGWIVFREGMWRYSNNNSPTDFQYLQRVTEQLYTQEKYDEANDRAFKKGIEYEKSSSGKHSKEEIIEALRNAEGKGPSLTYDLLFPQSAKEESEVKEEDIQDFAGCGAGQCLYPLCDCYKIQSTQPKSELSPINESVQESETDYPEKHLQRIEAKLGEVQEESGRPNLKDYFKTLPDIHNAFLAAPELYNYTQALDQYIDSKEAPLNQVSVEDQTRVIFAIEMLSKGLVDDITSLQTRIVKDKGVLIERKNWIQRLFCKHNFSKWIRNIYGDEIIKVGYKRSIWQCDKCGGYHYSDNLHYEGNTFIYE